MGRPRAVNGEADIEELRSQFNHLTSRFGPIPKGAAFEPAQIGPVKGEWVRVDGAASHRLILYFHGGGYVSGAPENYRPLVARLCAAAQANAFSVSYRLAPEFAFPAGLRDGIDAYRHLLQAGFAASQIVLAGDGSGGGLVFSCLLAIRNAGLEMPAACVAMSPWADMSLTGWSMLQNEKKDSVLSWELLFMSARHYLKKQNPTDPYASPIYAPFRDFPPIMVHAGSAEVLRDDASRIGDRAAEAGVPVSVEIYDGMQHLFQASTYVPEAKVSLNRLGQFIRQRVPDTGAKRAAG
ncbi:MAG TPA: alpha/beta hydrolase [Rhizomicrobium sp.]